MKNSFLYKKLHSFYSYALALYRKKMNQKYAIIVEKMIQDENIECKIDEINLKFENTDNHTYYIIRRDNPYIGLLTYVSVFLGHIAYAIEKGYIPVIDMKSFKSIYLDEHEVGKKNAWEYYFEQPFNIGLEDIKNGDRVIYSPKYTQPASPFMNSLFDNKESHFWKVICENYVRLNDKTRSYVLDEYKHLLEGKRLLGLLYRGTDYLSLKPKDHPIQPSIESFIEVIERYTNDCEQFDAFYLATDDQKAFIALNERFPNMIIVNKRTYYDSASNARFLAEVSFDRNDDAFLKGLEYLSSIQLLSRCDAIIASPCAGTYAANFFRKREFTFKYFFNLGYY
ncbi:hypothetical protein [Sphingobacterium multivorum]|uniref:hypothetical protein n=1 Tax=Sphingobacterium multivorum TaxID=28454 RepID=UPI0028A0FC15|nr:hypothetical protein [Sphingobacterium multivorum]